MRALRYENDFLRWRVTACLADRDRDTGLQVQEPEGEPEIQVVRDQTDVHEGQSSLPQDQARQDAGERGGRRSTDSRSPRRLPVASYSSPSSSEQESVT